MKQLLSVLLFVCALHLPLTVLAANETRTSSSQAAVATINVNSASAKELQSLPGIGKATAENIIAYRSANGPFKSKDDLLKVKGIGDKTMEKIRQLVAVQ